jgi:hypothetical protein
MALRTGHGAFCSVKRGRDAVKERWSTLDYSLACFLIRDDEAVRKREQVTSPRYFSSPWWLLTLNRSRTFTQPNRYAWRLVLGRDDSVDRAISALVTSCKPSATRQSHQQHHVATRACCCYLPRSVPRRTVGTVHEDPRAHGRLTPPTANLLPGRKLEV